LTNGTFPYDANIKLNSYVKTEAIASGVYMDTLSAKEDIAYVMTDLVQGYLKKTNHFDIALPLTWLKTVLLHYPDYPNAMILKAELQKEQYTEVMKERGAINFSVLWKDNTMKARFAELEKSYYQIHQLGYRRMPKEMYLNWLFRVKNDKTRKPYVFTNPQPFKQYNYNVQIVNGGDGQNSEAFDTEEVVRIGTVELNRFTGKILKFIDYTEDEIPDEVISRMYDPALGRWWEIDPKSEKYYSLAPYNYAANNPILFSDPNGEEIFVYHYVQGTDGEEGHWERGHMSKATQRALEAFAKTKEGYAFLSQYAKAGQKIGNKEFKMNGEFSDQNLNFLESFQESTRHGSSDITDATNAEKKIDVNINLNVKYINQDEGARYALTIGHESLIHMANYDDKMIASFREAWKTHKWTGFEQAKLDYNRNAGFAGVNDHSRYINNEASRSFNNYASQLKAIMNPKAVDAAKKEHDSNYKDLKK
jgi:RHS repeat-associated protein